MNLESVSLVVSLAALVVAVVSAWSTRRAQAGQLEIQSRLLALEGTRERAKIRHSRQGKLVARIDKQNRTWRLVVENQGNASAKNIQLRLDGQAPEAHALWVHGQPLLDHIGSGSDARYILGVAMGKPVTFEVELVWADESGEPGVWSSQVKI